MYGKLVVEEELITCVAGKAYPAVGEHHTRAGAVTHLAVASGTLVNIPQKARRPGLLASGSIPGTRLVLKEGQNRVPV